MKTTIALLNCVLFLCLLGSSAVMTQDRVELEPRTKRVLTVEMLIVDAAVRFGVPPSRALALAWEESRYQAHPNQDRGCCAGPMQLSKKIWPPMSTRENVERGVGWLAVLIQRHGADAETVYRKGSL
jgi:hypothetical protein